MNEPVKRYKVGFTSSTGSKVTHILCEESSDGNWVDYADYAALQAELGEVRKSSKDLETSTDLFVEYWKAFTDPTSNRDPASDITLLNIVVMGRKALLAYRAPLSQETA